MLIFFFFYLKELDSVWRVGSYHLNRQDHLRLGLELIRRLQYEMWALRVLLVLVHQVELGRKVVDQLQTA